MSDNDFWISSPNWSPGGQGVPSQQASNSGLTGEDYLTTLPTARANLIRAMGEGRQNVPQNIWNRANPVSVALMNDLEAAYPGIDATLIQRRKTFNTGLGQTTPNSPGGQKNLLGTSLNHLAEVADSAVDMNNSNGLGIAPLAHIWNGAYSLLSTDQAAKANNLNEKVDRASGEIGKLYSGSQGGVTERELTRNRFGQASSSAELASGLEAARDLIHGKINALDQQQGDLGPGWKSIDMLGDSGRASLDRINKAIARLKGLPPEGGAPQPAGSKTSTGVGWRIVQ